MNFVDRILIELEVKLLNAQTRFKTLDKALHAAGDRLQKAHASAGALGGSMKGLQNTLLGVGLSFLFTGMAIKNFFQGALQSLLQTFLQVEGEGGVVNDRVNELLASLEFLKFSLIDAFVDSGAMDFWIEKIESLVDWFNGLSDGTKSFIVSLMIVALIAGLAFMFLGQVMLGVLGLIVLIEFIGAPLFIFLAVLVIALVAVFLIWTSKMSLAEKILWTIVVVLAVIAVAMLLIGGIAALPFVIILVLVAALIALFAVLVRKTGGIADAFIVLGLTILWVLAHIADAILYSVLKPIQMFIDMIIKLIEIANRVPGINISTKGLSKISDAMMDINLSRRVEGLGASIMAERDQKRAEQQKIETEAEKKPSVTNNFNIEGIISEDNMQGLLGRLNQTIGFNNGSPQQ